MPKRLLIISHDVVGTLMAGPGIRYWELARALAPHAAVTLAAPQPIDLAAPGVATASYRWGEAASLAPLLAAADVVLANGYLLEPHPELAATERPLIVDLYDPTLLENLEALRALAPAERAERSARDVALLNRQLAAGDMFLCATERQRDLYVGALMAAGRVTPARADADPLLRGLIDVVPFGLPAEPPARTGPGLRDALPGVGPDDPLILWSGGLWDWMDPLTLVRAMPAVLERVPNARLAFLAGAHPGAVAAPRAPGQARALAAELGLLDRSVFFYEQWVPYLRRADFLLDAAVVVSLHRQHLETAYAALRSRFLDHLWVGLPSVLTDGDQAAALAREHGLGAVAPPQDAAAVADALAAVLGDDELRAAQAARARALAARFTWPALVRPIVAFLTAAPAARPPREYAPMPAPETPAPRQPQDVALMERETLLHATRNSAVQALEHTWRLDGLTPPGGGRLGGLRQRLLDRVVWPLLFPLIARQQEHNAAVLRAVYASTEQNDLLADKLAELSKRIGELRLRCDHLGQGLAELNERGVHERNLVAQQVRDFAEQLAGLEEAEVQIRALLRGEGAPPPASAPAEEA
jgi:glycosyltransferase involved in cell wall biosynthesis